MTGSLFSNQPPRPGVYLNPALIWGPAFNQENMVIYLSKFNHQSKIEQYKKPEEKSNNYQGSLFETHAC